MKKLIPISLFSVLYFVIASINISNSVDNPFVHVFDTLYVQEHEVTVSEYRSFASETEAERLGVSLVFEDELTTKKGASWKKNDGRKMSRYNYPVTHLTAYEMQDYCECLGARLMTLQEFHQIYQPNEEGNVWEGLFPLRNTLDDGYKYIAPVKSYKPNKYGIYDLKGNVWEITSTKSKQNNAEFYIAGGSYMEQSSTIYKYPQFVFNNTTLPNVGFRCVMDKQTYCNVYE